MAIDEFFDEKNNFELKILKRGLERCDNFKSEAYNCLDKENKKLLLKNIVELKYEKDRNKNIEDILKKGFDELKKKNLVEKNLILKNIKEKEEENEIEEKEFIIKRQNYLKNYNIDFIDGKNNYDVKNLEEKQKMNNSFFGNLKIKKLSQNEAKDLAEKTIKNKGKISELKKEKEKIKVKELKNMNKIIDRQIISKLNKNSVKIAKNMIYRVLRQVYNYINSRDEKIHYFKQLEIYLENKKKKIREKKFQKLNSLCIRKIYNNLLEKILGDFSEDVCNEILSIEVKSKQICHNLFAKVIFKENNLKKDDLRILDIFQFINKKNNEDLGITLDKQFEQTILFKEEEDFVYLKKDFDNEVKNFYKEEDTIYEKDKEVINKIKEACMIF